MKNTLKQLKEQRASIVEELSEMIELSEKENRNLNEKEQETFDSNSVKVEDLNTRIERLERTHKLKYNLSAETPVTHGVQDVAKTDKDLKRYSISDAARAAMNRNIEGVVKEMHQEAINESDGRIFRGVGVPAIALEKRSAVAFNANGSAATANSTEAASFIDQINANTVLAQAGANVYSGISANRKLPILAGISAEYVAENGGSGVDPAGTVTPKTLEPNKLISVVTYTQEMFVQNASVDAALERNMANVIAATMEANLLAASNASAGPASLFAQIADVQGSTATDNLTAAKLFEMETGVLGKASAASRLAYIVNPALLAQIKALAGVEFSSQFLDNAQKTVNGYPYYVTTNIGGSSTASGMFGDISDIHIAHFGGLDLISDRFSEAEKGLSRLIVISLNDGEIARPTDLHKKFIDSNA